MQVLYSLRKTHQTKTNYLQNARRYSTLKNLHYNHNSPLLQFTKQIKQLKNSLPFYTFF